MGKHYNYRHQQERTRWKPAVETGRVMCHAKLCLMPDRLITPDYTKRGDGWDIGHTPDRTRWTGPEHAKCNRSEGARRGNDARKGKVHTRRFWPL